MALVAQRIEQIAREAELRGGIEHRRADGAFFTSDDVADWLATRAIHAWLLDQLDYPVREIDDALAAGVDTGALLAAHAARVGIDRAIELLERVRILDPTCGAGSFLVAAWRVLEGVGSLLDRPLDCSPEQLHGIDVDAGAVQAAAEVFALATGRSERPRLTCANVLDETLDPFDIVLGNPPYVRVAPTERGATGTVPNVSAHVVEHALEALADGGRAAFVLPISTSCTDAFTPARHHWASSCDVVHACHFDTIPASLFAGVVQRLSIFEGRRRSKPLETAAIWYSSRYHRWLTNERATLLDTVRHQRLPSDIDVDHSLPKVGSQLELELLERIALHEPAARLLTTPAAEGAAPIHYKRRWSYFLLFTDFMPPIWDSTGAERAPTEFKTLHVRTEREAKALLAVYSSTLFWWYFAVHTDNRNVNLRDLRAFPVPRFDEDALHRLAELADELMVALRGCAEVRTCTYRSIGTIRNTYFRQAATRPVLDAIDEVLAAAYGITPQQLAFVLGHEHRFRS